ncbi:pentapeptide repeat-containing protein [Terasakiella brassicae]|nr:pentapeptide repeat-containing protein [Terasakiella brassicae]
MSNILKHAFLTAVFGLGLATSAQAWTDQIDPKNDINTRCKFEPEAQCTDAIRVGAQIEGVDMSYSSMPKMRLDGANMKRINLQGSNMEIINLKGADLTLANLSFSQLHAANLQNANLMLSNMTKALLVDADLRGANLQGANIQGAVFFQANLSNATWVDGRVCAEGSIGECK